ncbi:Centromere protein L [Channa argus]|uniref:Centromere protein L n=1 Tax=Channa argus TaxID=215402 RepID=A0A6G1QVG8_CHAAH|nr:Centromere protein L [Channa argus]
MARTPLNSIVAQRRSKSKSYRQSYRSCLGASSRLGLTPALTARRLNTSRRAPKSHNITEKLNPEQLALLTKTEWKMSYVTPLYQFRHTQLKSYSRQLSAFIAAEKQQGLAIEVEGSESSFRVSFSVLSGMAETDEDPETVLLQIFSKPMFARQDEPQRSVWSGWLACINGNPDYLRSLPKDFICLPLFGSYGPDALTSVVQSWFQQNFDCYFGPLEINHTIMPPLQITYTINPEDAWELWSSVRKVPQEEKEGKEEEGSSIDIDEVMRFMQGLKSHFYRHFRLDLSVGTLVQVSTALGSAKCNGRIKISNSRYMITTLTLLTEGALLKMPI